MIDVHCHLDICEDIPGVIEKSRKNGVKIIITNGVDVETNRKSLEFAKKYPEVKVALGIYPINALSMSDKELDAEIEFIRKNKDRIVAVGEVGIDLKENNNLEKQIKNFRKFINLAKELKKPLIIHSRKAENECISVLEEEKAEKVVMHCFSGNMRLIERIQGNGWMLSIPANVTFSEHFQNVIRKVDVQNLLCETDSPYLHPNKEFPNDPSNVVASYKKLAEIKGLSLKDIEQEIEKNYKRIFEGKK